MRDKEIEFKSYGLYSDVAKSTDYTVDQISTVYDWYLKKTLKKIVNEDTVQADFKNLGKFKLNPKKGINYLNKYYKKIIDAIQYYEDYKDNPERDTKVYYAYLVIQNRYSTLQPSVLSFNTRLDKLLADGGISKEQYDFHKKRTLDLIEKVNQLYEPIQRISESRKERGQKL